MSISFLKLGKFSFIIFFKLISNFLLFLFFWHPYDVNVGVLEVVPHVADTILGFFGLFFLLGVLIGCFCFPMFQIIDLILGFIHSTVVSL